MDNNTSNEKTQETLKHSEMGIASFIISLLIGIFYFILLIIGSILEMSSPGTLPADSPSLMILGLCVILGLFINLIGIGLGIAGIFHKNRKHIFSILGLIFNSSIILGMFILIILGNLAV